MLLAVAITALLAAGITACGGGDSNDSTSTPTVAGQGTTAPEDQGSGKGEKERSGDETGSSRGSDDSPSGEGSSSSSGEGSASFRTPGGDNSIQSFGAEADPAQADEASAVLASYLGARAKDEWARECAYLAKVTVAPLEQLAAGSPQLKGKGCAAILAALAGNTPTSTRANTMTSGIASLRVEGDRGFALYHGAHGTDYFLPMVREGGRWKVGSLAPSEFP